MNVTLIPIHKDNYTYLLEAENGQTAIVDPGDADPVVQELERQGLKLDYILLTHHHWDHIDGTPALKEKYSAQVIGPAAEQHRIPNMDTLLKEGDTFAFGDEDIQTIETPGHTTGHICFYFPDSGILFAGDTLFSMSCGRLFEGTPAQMWNSFEKLMALPDETQMYCGHEYTVSNGEFGQTIEPDNQDIKTRLAEARALRAENKPTLPSTMGMEKKTNVFLRAGSAERFAEIRELKDQS